jgi:DNA-binding CsgD family transcriptional regulator
MVRRVRGPDRAPRQYGGESSTFASSAVGPGVLSTSLLALYREAEHRAPDAHLEWALDGLQQLVRFDAALWIDGHSVRGEVEAYRTVVAGPGAGLLQGHDAVRHADALLLDAVRQPGIAVARPMRGDGAGGQFEAFASRQGIDHGLAVCCVDAHTSLASTIALYRRHPGKAFGAAESEYLEALAPHLIETRAIAAIQSLLLATRADGAMLSSSGVADGQARLQVAPPDFQRLMRLEWPAWRERALPSPLAALTRGRSAWRYAGERIVVKASAMNDVFLLQPREKRAVDELSARELEVARLMADGHTYKQAAQRLGVAPSTVRNHLRAIFATLGVRRQSEMAAALRDVD